MHRRDFLAGALALPAIRHLEPAATPRFGCAAITWAGKDDVAIDDISSLGFRGIQLRTAAVERWGSRPTELKDLLASRKLAFTALSSGVVLLDPGREDENLELHLRNARFARDAGGAFLQVVDERPGGRAPSAADFARVATLLDELGKRTADLGVTLAYHNHVGNLGQAPDEVEAVLSRTDSRRVRLLLDVAHWQAAGGDPVAAVRRYADRLAFLHLKDLQRTPADAGGRAFRFVELGRGEVNLQGVIRELSRATYDGWAIVELDAVTDPLLTPRQCAQTSKEYLASIGYSP